MPDAFFDIVVVGTNISGLAYGALCAKHGYTVLVVGQDARPSTYTTGSALMFRSNPFFHGFSSSSVLHGFFRDIGMLAEMRNRPEKIDPILQVITPGARFDLSARPEATVEEFRRVFPDAAAELEQFLRSATFLRNSRKNRKSSDDENCDCEIAFHDITPFKFSGCCRFTPHHVGCRVFVYPVE